MMAGDSVVALSAAVMDIVEAKVVWVVSDSSAVSSVSGSSVALSALVMVLAGVVV